MWAGRERLRMGVDGREAHARMVDFLSLLRGLSQRAESRTGRICGRFLSVYCLRWPVRPGMGHEAQRGGEKGGGG